MIERQAQSLLDFNPQRKSATVAEITSVIAESHQKTDIYFYYLKEGVLHSPTHKIPVSESTKSQKDKDLIHQIESWANQNKEGYAIWVSPPQEEGEISTKLVLMRLISGKNYKMIENQSVLLDLDQEQIQSLVDFFVSCSVAPKNEISIGEVRYSLIILYKKDEALNLLKQFYPDGWEQQKTRIKEALKIQKTYSSRSDHSNLLSLREVVGPHPLSCSLLGSNIIFNGTTVVREPHARYLDCTCPFCHLKVKAKIEGGKIYCPACGQSVDYYC